MYSDCLLSQLVPSISGRQGFCGGKCDFHAALDHVELEKFLRDRCAATEGETWQAIGAQLTRLGRWEFDYRL
ncbi:MAG: hypothetical protein EOQ33_30435 [Mesorhizobium sp.]|nr:MAG: hypothetical protein EOQ33_30435 [Mesorhizobium sp.]